MPGSGRSEELKVASGFPFAHVDNVKRRKLKVLLIHFSQQIYCFQSNPDSIVTLLTPVYHSLVAIGSHLLLILICSQIYFRLSSVLQTMTEWPVCLRDSLCFDCQVLY